MVKDDLRSLMIWVVAAVVVLQTVKCDLFSSLWQEGKEVIAEKQLHYSDTLSAEEVDEFIRLWPQYNQFKLRAYSSSSLSISSKMQTDWKTKIWLVYHKVDIDRFMYAHQRLKELLKAFDNKKKAQAVAKQLSLSKDELSQEMSVKHQRYADTIKLDDGEAEIIKQKETELKQLFRLYP